MATALPCYAPWEGGGGGGGGDRKEKVNLVLCSVATLHIPINSLLSTSNMEKVWYTIGYVQLSTMKPWANSSGESP